MKKVIKKIKKAVKTVEKLVDNTCEVCIGKGRISDKESCDPCKGTGVKKY